MSKSYQVSVDDYENIQSFWFDDEPAQPTQGLSDFSKQIYCPVCDDVFPFNSQGEPDCFCNELCELYKEEEELDFNEDEYNDGEPWGYCA